MWEVQESLLLQCEMPGRTQLVDIVSLYMHFNGYCLIKSG